MTTNGYFTLVLPAVHVGSCRVAVNEIVSLGICKIRSKELTSFIFSIPSCLLSYYAYYLHFHERCQDEPENSMKNDPAPFMMEGNEVQHKHAGIAEAVAPKIGL